MDERTLYAKLLRLEAPWAVRQVDVNDAETIVHFWLECPRGTGDLPCPKCPRRCPVYDHRERQWRHLDTMQFETRIHASVPRVECPDHGVRQVNVPWAGSGSRFTVLFEGETIDWLGEASVAAVGRRLRLSWGQCWTVMRRAVARGLERREELDLFEVGVDEKSFQRRHDYVTIITDLIEPRVLYVGDDRTQETLEAFWAMGLNDRQREGIEAVAMDMWKPYIQATKARLPDGEHKIVFDRFHVAKHLGEAVDRVRRAEAKELAAKGDRRLVGTRYTWLRSPENFTAQAWKDFAPLRDSSLKVARAWAMKDAVGKLWSYRSVAEAQAYFKRWYFWATHSRLRPMIEKAWMMKRHLAGILGYLQHRLTNAASEALNSKIQAIRTKARGFRNRGNYKTAIYFHCGNLDLYPLPTHTVQ